MKKLILTFLPILSLNAFAGETMFGYIYTTDTIPKGHWEYEQIHTFRTGKSQGSYNALDLRNEFEYGVTDKLQAALYINSSYIRMTDSYMAEGTEPMTMPNKNQYQVDGASVELIYRVLSPYTNSFGLAFYVEPELSVRDHMTGEDRIERSVEMRIILQKNFFDDNLIVAANIMAEPEWEMTTTDESAKELWAELTLGATYRVAPKWFVGVEARNHMEFIDMNFNNNEHQAYFFGPSVHYGDEKFWAQFTVLPQVYGWPRNLGSLPDGREITSNYAHLGQHEKLEVRFKFGIPF